MKNVLLKKSSLTCIGLMVVCLVSPILVSFAEDDCERIETTTTSVCCNATVYMQTGICNGEVGFTKDVTCDGTCDCEGQGEYCAFDIFSNQTEITVSSLKSCYPGQCQWQGAACWSMPGEPEVDKRMFYACNCDFW